MRLFKISAVVATWALCFVFTGRGAARADSQQSLDPDRQLSEDLRLDAEERYVFETERVRTVEVPPPPGQRPFSVADTGVYQTSGPTARVGSVVGSVDVVVDTATALGVSAAVGHRFGRLAIESEGMVMRLLEPGPSPVSLGYAGRLGVIARFDVVRATMTSTGRYTLLAMFVEGGASQTWNHWYERDDEAVPTDTSRVEGQAGFGIAIDHVLSPGGFASRMAWHLGWRLAAPPQSEPEYACRGSCRLGVAQVSEPRGEVDGFESSVLFQSSLAVTW